MIVLIPSALLSYTGRRSEVEAEGASVGAMLEDLDRRFPGIRFRVLDEQDRIREHLRVYVNGQPSQPATPIGAGDEVAILMSLSGG